MTELVILNSDWRNKHTKKDILKPVCAHQSTTKISLLKYDNFNYPELWMLCQAGACTVTRRRAKISKETEANKTKSNH
jgi:hypothetical protein